MHINRLRCASSHISPKTIPVVPCHSLMTRDLAVAIVMLGDFKFILVSVYLDMNVKPELQTLELDKILDYAAKKHFLIIIKGDFNAHNPLWGGKQYRQTRH